jgi:hypothetical protein
MKSRSTHVPRAGAAGAVKTVNYGHNNSITIQVLCGHGTKIKFSEGTTRGKKVRSRPREKNQSKGQYKYFVYAFTTKIMLTRKQRRDKSRYAER